MKVVYNITQVLYNMLYYQAMVLVLEDVEHIISPLIPIQLIFCDASRDEIE